MVVPASALRFATFSSIITLCLCTAQARADAGAGGTSGGGGASAGSTASSGAGGASGGSGGTLAGGGTSSGGTAAGGAPAAGGMSASGGSPGGTSSNLITNGTFDGTAADPWWKNASTSSDPPADMSMAVSNGQLCATIVSGGQNPWDVIIGYSGLNLMKNQAYHIKFTISADAPRKVKFKTGMGVDPYSDYFIEPISITATPQTFEYTYSNFHEDASGQFQFQIGTYGSNAPSAGTVCVDNVVVEPVPTPAQPSYTTSAPSGHPFKDYTKVVKMGTAVDTPIFLSNPLHNSIVAGEFAMITPANSMKMNVIQPKQGTFDFTDTDALLAWAKASGLEFRGHPLVWHTQAPNWLTSPTTGSNADGTFTKDELVAIMYAHIDALMAHYKGQLPYWDVVNEAIDGTDYRSTFWYKTIGAEFIDLAFQRAHMDDPDAKLFYNDYNIEQKGNAKADRVFELVKDMKTRGIPINGIGFQGHYFVEPDGTTSNGVPDMQAIRENMARYNEIGVEVQITECDFRIGKPLDDTKQQLQNKFYADMLQACIDAENCDHMTVWGLSDLDSWVPSTFPEYDYAHLFDSSLKPKADYTAMANVFAKYNPADGKPLTMGGGGGGGGSGGSGSGGAAPVAPAAAAPDSGGCSISSGKTGSALWLLGALGAVGALLTRRRKSTRG